jgi:hypothetical protein
MDWRARRRLLSRCDARSRLNRSLDALEPTIHVAADDNMEADADDVLLTLAVAPEIGTCTFRAHNCTTNYRDVNVPNWALVRLDE